MPPPSHPHPSPSSRPTHHEPRRRHQLVLHLVRHHQEPWLHKCAPSQTEKNGMLAVHALKPKKKIRRIGIFSSLVLAVPLLFGNGHGHCKLSTLAPTLDPSQPVASCVVCINALLKARLSWKPHGVQYTLSYMRALQLLHPPVTIRLLPVLFTSLPQSVPISHSVTRPCPFLELIHFRSTLPGLLPLTLTLPPRPPSTRPQTTAATSPPSLMPSSAPLTSSTADPLPPSPTLAIGPDPRYPLLPPTTNISSSSPPRISAHPPSLKISPLASSRIIREDGTSTRNKLACWSGNPLSLVSSQSLATPFYSTSWDGHFGPQAFHAIRQQNLIRPLHQSHCVVLGGFSELHTPSNKRPASMPSNNNLSVPFSPNPHLAASRSVC
ncbi:hypothetical protein PCANC_02325 [Puccinia coronata f. sp. avenae]|uniref:Uncharacterized protein n=1 Tax=Puccinia coronata f. sp. avenae TaxID=200324 RepID=A0A2N5VZG4_9BASI|nr:hypothetical protein PCANC_25085 [Puccinia coronata f. sp. avenae]PLW55389.1 hypothetical protein PCANC_02325 [Puccinia coronata f. sp. avenae]